MKHYHYFVVTFDYHKEEVNVLVRAEDVIEAGKKAFDTYSKDGLLKDRINITKVERINIHDIIE